MRFGFRRKSNNIMGYGGDRRLCIRARATPTILRSALSSAVCPPAHTYKRLATTLACASVVAPPVYRRELNSRVSLEFLCVLRVGSSGCMKGLNMFNFAVAGSLERYQPIQREPSIRLVDSVKPVSGVNNIKAGLEGENLEFPEGISSASTAKSHLVKSYGSGAPGGEPQQRRRAWTVADLMTKLVRTLRAEESIPAARSLLEQTGFRHIPIVNSLNQVEGLVSDRDLLRLSDDQKSDPSRPISTIMTKRVLTCFPETSLRLAAHTMLEEGFSSLPVVDRHGVLLGILTTGDILKALVNEAPVDLWA